MSLTTHRSQSLRILLADPHDDRRAELRDAIAASGHLVVAETADGEEALSIARRIRPDIVIADAQLPRLGGVELAHLLNRREIAPAAVMIASQQRPLLRKAVLAGAMAVYTTPVSAAGIVANLPIAASAWHTHQRSVKQLTALSERLQARDTVDSAKALLMRRHGLTEAEAYRRLQRSAMDTRRSMRGVAEAVLTTAGIASTPSSVAQACA